MPDPAKKPSKAEEVAKGFASVSALARKAAEQNKKKDDEKPEPPQVDTGSVGGFISSAAKRLKYAVYGPENKKKDE